MRKPDGHQPVIQRYSSRVENDIEAVRLLVFGQQSDAGAAGHVREFVNTLKTIFEASGQPLHHDLASFVDPQGYSNIFSVCYWYSEDDYLSWRAHFDTWLAEQDPVSLDRGCWVESFCVPVTHRETIAFKEYLRGLSACPMSRIESMDESGYWGAARDRIPASAHDALSPSKKEPLTRHNERQTLGKRIAITDLPDNLCVIRSGVSWNECGDEQLSSYRKNLEPKLDAGMTYLRQNPVDTGCCSLRQVNCLDAKGNPQKEAYSLGIFLSLGHLEEWAKSHPTHLAIYHRALAERKKYQERLELKTYHEVYVLNDNLTFEYINCHNETGLLPFFSAEV